ncbi:MAG: DEAD/DEAH box helicase family protein, partial [Halanaerobiales bacterium]
MTEEILFYNDYEKKIIDNPDDNDIKRKYIDFLIDEISLNSKIDKKKYIKRLKELIEVFPEEKTLFDRSFLSYINNDFKTSLKWLSKYIQNLKTTLSSDQYQYTFLLPFNTGFKGFWETIAKQSNINWPDSAQVYTSYGFMELFTNKNIDKALEFFRQSLKCKNDYWLASLKMGDIHYEKNNWESAIKYYNLALKSSEPQNYPDVYFKLAWSYGKLRKYKEEENAYRYCLNLEANFNNAWNNLGYSLYKQKKYKEALEIFNKSLEKDIDGKYPVHNKIETLKNLKRYEEALEFIKECKQKGVLTSRYTKNVEEIKELISKKKNNDIELETDNDINNEDNDAEYNRKFYYEHAGKIKVAREDNPISLYFHQREAIKELDNINKNHSFSGMLAIPTGGGKTLTAIYWLLKNAIDKGKKVLWTAHRHELLSQAFLALKGNSYKNLVQNRVDFNYRIISGQHDRAVNISHEDDFIIASKDSLYRNMDYLIENWADGLDEVFLVVDEAHHSTAKTYRRIIEGLNNNVDNFKMIGLTSTPFRTPENEKGLLKKLFADDILYKVDLRSLINREILSEPIFEELNTELNIFEELTDADIRKINSFDLQGDIAEKIAKSKVRNNRIVEHYLSNRYKFGKLIVFAIDIDHAISLTSLFKKRGISAEYVVSSLIDADHRITISADENREKIKKFREGECDVLVNVNILNEGVDLPDTQ